jgi:aspartate kinase
MALIVQKFGGSSVANTERIRNVAEIVTSTYKAGNDVIVIVSAQGDTTDDLIAKAAEITPHPSKREMDVLLATGEQASMALLAMTISEMGFPVVSLAAWQIQINSDSTYGSSRIRSVGTTRLKNELDRKAIIIVAGFQGVNRHDDITTLGRGGSDTTAVAIAVSMRADLCQIYTDVDGVYTADPRLVKGAKKLDTITYDEMLELASLGAQVLHNRSVEMAKRYNINLEVISSITRKPGTIVKEVSAHMERMLISGVAKDNNCAMISLIDLPDIPGIAFKTFSLLAKGRINVDVIVQSVGNITGRQDISFTVSIANLEEALKLLEESKEIIGYTELYVNENISKVSIVGAGMANNPGIAAGMFEALYNEHINIIMISTSEIKVSVLIDRDSADRAVVAIHDKFLSGKK